MVNESMEYDKLYEWVIIDSYEGTRNGRRSHHLRYRCTTAPTTITEFFIISKEGSCKAIDDRLRMMGIMHDTPINLSNTLRISTTFWAKVQCSIESDGTVKWAFMPTSFIKVQMHGSEINSHLQGTDKKLHVQEVVEKAMSSKEPYEKIIKDLASMGKEYVTEYRRRRAELREKS